MKIVHITSELYPFMEGFKTEPDGTGENIYHIAVALAHRGNDIHVFLPLYGFINRESHGIVNSGLKTWVTVKDTTFEFEVYKANRESVNFYFLYNGQLFDRPGTYGSADREYSDNDVRFGSYCRACLNFISFHMPDAQITHSYDWQTALVPVYSRVKYFNSNWVTVHTINEIAAQGIFPRFSIENLGLPWEMFNMEQLEYYDSINFTKGAVLYADSVVGVDLAQAESFLMSSSGFGLDGVFKKNQDKLSVIKNAIDYNVWSPEKDEYIHRNYSVMERSGKEHNKKVWCREYDLDSSLPLFSVAGRNLKKHDIDTVLAVVSRLADKPLNLCLGGECSYDDYKHFTAKEYNNIRFINNIDQKWLHNALAASDFMFIPFINRFRGKERWISMRYGTIPIVRSFADTFYGDPVLFSHKGLDDFIAVVDGALDLYANEKEMREYIKAIMAVDNSWERCAEKYENLYKSLIPRGEA